MKYGKLRVTITVFIALVFLSGFSPGNLNAMSWPSENAVLVHNFGWNDRGRPVLGMVFAGDTPVLAAESGEIIFIRKKGGTASRLPSPFGSWTALDHGDGLVSIYSRYGEASPGDASLGEVSLGDTSSDALPNDTLSNDAASLEVRVSAKKPSAGENSKVTHVDKQKQIAASGISGWSNRKGFYFILYDRRERRWINPSMIVIPRREARAPQILSVNLVNEQGLSVNNAQLRNVNQGRYTVLVTTAGPAERDSFHALQRIVCSVNGAEAGSLNFESVFARDGVLMVYRNGLVPVRQIYSAFPAFEAAEVFLNRGQISLEVIVQDIAGNSRSAVTRMIVN